MSDLMSFLTPYPKLLVRTMVIFSKLTEDTQIEYVDLNIRTILRCISSVTADVCRNEQNHTGDM